LLKKTLSPEFFDPGLTGHSTGKPDDTQGKGKPIDPGVRERTCQGSGQ
jgi:hypothetical protein